LYSSHNDHNYFEIAWSLNRQFGPQGLYRGLVLYNFADNHDVDRVASRIADPANLAPLYTLLFCMPGIPSIYYGSEFGLGGRKQAGSDASLRPALDLNEITSQAPLPWLPEHIRQLAALRRCLRPLRDGDYTQLLVDHEQFAFSRQVDGEWTLVAVNSAGQPVSLDLPLPGECSRAADGLRPGDFFEPASGRLQVTVPAHGGRILSPAV
jgi:glycosidase